MIKKEDIEKGSILYETYKTGRGLYYMILDHDGEDFKCVILGSSTIYFKFGNITHFHFDSIEGDEILVQ